jgi:hemoglobin/transferrin/lactoferrin receptor protein
VVDLFASYKLNENLTFNISAENLADKFYVDPLGGTPIAAPGRTIHVGFTAKF